MSFEVANWVMQGQPGQALSTITLDTIETVEHEDGSIDQTLDHLIVTGEQASTAYVFAHLDELVAAHRAEDTQATATPEAQLEKLKEAVSKVVDLGALSDSKAAEVAVLYSDWEPVHAYTTGERVQYRGTLYKVLQSHTSQEGWEPDKVPSLFAQILPGQGGTAIGEWVQPDSTNPYSKGDIVMHSGKMWISSIDGNVWEPGVYGWE